MTAFKLLILSVTLLLSLIFASCQKATIGPLPKAPDYSQDKNWSIKSQPIHEIDVFFVHPTTYGPPANGKLIADLANEELNTVTDRDTVNWITAAFKGSCNIYAPRYRQMNIEVLTSKDSRLDQFLAVGISDIETAFKYYINNINNGRPFILASHSQGSLVLQTMIKQNPALLNREKLVAAYMPGWTFTNKDLAEMQLPLADSPSQTGCLITWNTIGPGGVSPTVLPGARCVNPLSWTTDGKEYPASNDIEAKIFLGPGKQMLIKNFTAARINKDGALEIPTPAPDVLKMLNMSLGKEVYHRYDYDFFYYNVIENVKLRCDAYLEKHS